MTDQELLCDICTEKGKRFWTYWTINTVAHPELVETVKDGYWCQDPRWALCPACHTSVEGILALSGDLPKDTDEAILPGTLSGRILWSEVEAFIDQAFARQIQFAMDAGDFPVGEELPESLVVESHSRLSSGIINFLTHLDPTPPTPDFRDGTSPDGKGAGL